MRRLYRERLDLGSRLNLHREGIRATDKVAARANWSRFRASVRCKPIENTLCSMAGTRQRCAYCSDSHASDIDHFVPISLDHSRAFQWSNLLWVCTRCNRAKGPRFQRDAAGGPLLIDPCMVDPWSKLTLDTASGFISPRFYNGDFDHVGEYTLKILETINYEAVAEGRLRSVRRLYGIFDRAFESNCSDSSRAELAQHVREDDMGISQWFAFWDGQGEPPAVRLRLNYPQFWRRYVRMCSSSP